MSTSKPIVALITLAAVAALSACNPVASILDDYPHPDDLCANSLNNHCPTPN